MIKQTKIILLLVLVSCMVVPFLTGRVARGETYTPPGPS
jgi:hypothetical protein